MGGGQTFFASTLEVVKLFSHRLKWGSNLFWTTIFFTSIFTTPQNGQFGTSTQSFYFSLFKIDRIDPTNHILARHTIPVHPIFTKYGMDINLDPSYKLMLAFLIFLQIKQVFGTGNWVNLSKKYYMILTHLGKTCFWFSTASSNRCFFCLFGPLQYIAWIDLSTAKT